MRLQQYVATLSPWPWRFSDQFLSLSVSRQFILVVPSVWLTVCLCVRMSMCLSHLHAACSPAQVSELHRDHVAADAPSLGVRLDTGDVASESGYQRDGGMSCSG